MACTVGAAESPPLESELTHLHAKILRVSDWQPNLTVILASGKQRDFRFSTPLNSIWSGKTRFPALSDFEEARLACIFHIFRDFLFVRKLLASVPDAVLRWLNSCFVSTFYIVFIIICIMPNIASAENASVGKKIFIASDKDDSIKPEVLVRARDGGFVVAGSTNARAWAAKLDPEGRVTWKYYAGQQQDGMYVPSPEFRGVAPMSDGTFYLCGVVPRQPGSEQPTAFVTHLDDEGHVLNEKLMVPIDEPRNSRNLSSFDSCIPWGDGVILLGNLTTVIRPGDKNVLPVAKYYYWIVAIDSSGKIRWERLVEFSFGRFSIVVSRNISLVTRNSTILFSVTDSNYTDIVAIDVDGNVKNRTKINGFFRLIQPVAGDSLIQLWGGVPGVHSSSIIDMDDALNEIAHVDDPSGEKYSPRFIFRMPDKSLISFGTGVHSFGRMYRAEGVRVDSSFKNRQTISLEQEEVDNAGQVLGAVQAGDDGVFLVAKAIVTKASMADSAGGMEESPGFRRGLLLEFVSFK